MRLNLQNYAFIVNQIDLHKFQKGIVEVQKRNRLYRTVPVGFYNKDSTGTLDYTKIIFTKLFHSSKSFNRFTKSLKKNVKHILGDCIDEVSNPHLSLFYLKIKKILECCNLEIPTFKVYNPVRTCMF